MCSHGCNGIFTDRSCCNPFKNNSVFKGKYTSIANQSLSIAEAIDVYVNELTEQFVALSNSESPNLLEANLVSETKSILNKMNNIFPCINLRYVMNGTPVTNWFSDFTQTNATGLYLLTPESPCGLGSIKIHCCKVNVSQNFTEELLPSVQLTQNYIDMWCCIAQQLRAIATFIQDYFC